MNIEDIISIGANCIVKIGNRFFLLVEIEVEFGNVAIEEFVFIRISEQEARILLAGGIQRCTIVNSLPRSCDDLEVEFICVLIAGGEAFVVFDVENDVDKAVLVPISLREAERLIRRGARRCTVINR
ncbi:hypothetical protein M3225_27430 [Priestia aryabhattai]|uniref:hypothetical protein n=1 Tax=Priestia aryabhattai TaxID=412384 RepID=UPI00203D0AC4|nr:hypothetical protein [Priestia aryabhattai]MCM3774149.1 hypothetical protein [Priestia aryabhattai]